MKITIYISCLLAAMLPDMKAAYSQQHDRHWMGHRWNFDLTEVILRFDEDSISFHPFNMTEKIYIDNGSLAMSNAEGYLQFYTNGNVVVSWSHKIMQGGKGLNKGATNDDFGVNGTDTLENTEYNPYTYRILPDAYDEHIYYIIHAFILEHGECKRIDVPKMQISKIDMSANGGKGKVVYKNRYFDQELIGAGFALVRHGNGMDWWVVLRKQDGLAYKSILLHRDTVVHVVNSSIPGLSADWYTWNDCFHSSLSLLSSSMDGSRLLDKYGENWAKLLTFDRCSGEISLIDTFATGIIPLVTLGGVVYNCPIQVFEFSPSGRYLYGAGWAEFAQWDLEATNIAASKVKLGGVPWALDDNQNVMVGISFDAPAFANGPDGKIYSLWRSTHSVIHYPDEPGAASGLCLAADNAPGSCLGPNVPYYLFSGRHPNFRLGPLPGSACDTIVSSTSEPVAGSGYGVSASPTVTSGQVEVSITLPSYGSHVTAEVQVVDMLGRVVHQHHFPPYAYLHTIDVRDWAAGVYNIVLVEGSRARASTRLVVAR